MCLRVFSAGSHRANKGGRREKQPEFTGLYHAATAKEQSGRAQERDGNTNARTRRQCLKSP
jgi:hypothetical protein